MSRLYGAVMLGLLLAGCAQHDMNAYEWRHYQSSLYDYLRDDGGDVGMQIDRLEESMQIAAAKDKLLPPGFHAHLAMLYFRVGRDGDGVTFLQREKQLFPESSAFVDFLLQQQEQAR